MAEQPGWVRPVEIMAWHAGTVVLGAVGDGLYDEGRKELGHAFHAAEVCALIGGPFLFKVKLNEAIPYIGSYACMRFAIFDMTYNGVRGLPAMYNGTTSTYDKVMNKIPPDGSCLRSHALVRGLGGGPAAMGTEVHAEYGLRRDGTPG